VSYRLWVAAGVLLAFAVSRLQRDERPELAERRPLLLLAAVIGAVAGAFLFELPADRYGWTTGTDGDAAPGLLLGRPVLGGLIGGWLAVEAAKLALGVRGPTGDGFALPLACALACGRLGCASAGCCAGSELAHGAWWSAFAVHDAHGVARFPAQLAEAAFHALAAALLLVAARRGWMRGRRVAAYLAVYAVVRFLIESERANPPIALGMTYYQFLARGLFALAGGMWCVRSVRAGSGKRIAESGERRADSGSADSYLASRDRASRLDSR
jgi:phosphatidylglycerol:prolipoprotein diacylglycerol transferase